MNTHFLGDDDVQRYVLDLVDRLIGLGDNFPLVWCTIGESGEQMAVQILNALPIEKKEKVGFVRLSYNKLERKVCFENIPEKDELKQVVLVLDSSVHSGSTMYEVVKALRNYGATNILSYTLVLKRGASFIPNYFGIVISDHDRALFKLEKYSNNRLCKKPPFGTLRKLDGADVHLEPDHIQTDVQSISKITWGDLWYEKQAKSSQVYVYELNGKIQAFLSFKIIKNSVLFIDAIAVSSELKGSGIGGVLMRWAETWARSNNCSEVELWSIDEKDRIGFYRNFGFDETGQALDLGKGEKYKYMRRVLLYNLDLHCIE